MILKIDNNKYNIPISFLCFYYPLKFKLRVFSVIKKN